MNDIAKLVPTKSDAELAEELKKELAEAAKPWLETCTKAKSMGFDVQASFQLNAFKQVVIQQLVLSKTY